VFDMPGGGMRYVREAIGVDWVLVNGDVAWCDGRYTQARAGHVCT
jgi:hypothetical protein